MVAGLTSLCLLEATIMRALSASTFPRRSLLAVSTVLVGLTLLSTSAFAAPVREMLDRWLLGIERVQPFDVDVLDLRVNAQTIWVIGDGDTDLDCHLYHNGVLVSSDTDSTDICLLPTNGRRGAFRLTVSNIGVVYNEYRVEAEN